MYNHSATIKTILGLIKYDDDEDENGKHKLTHTLTIISKFLDIVLQTN